MTNRFPKTHSGISDVSDINLVDVFATGSIQGLGGTAKLVDFDRGGFRELANKDGPLLVNNVAAEDPIKTEKTNGVATLSFALDPVHLYVDDKGRLAAHATGYAKPLAETDGVVALHHDETLRVDPAGQLSVNFDEILVGDGGGGSGGDETTNIAFDNESKTLKVRTADPVTTRSNAVTLKYDTSLALNQDGDLTVNPGPVLAELQTADPIALTPEGAVALKFRKGLKLKDGELQTDVNNVLKPLGALHTGSYLDVALDELQDLAIDGIESLFGGDNPDQDVSLIRLKTSSDFTQKGLLSGMKCLAIKNKGANRIPYYATISDEFDTRAAFAYNETLNWLTVGDVELDSRFSFSPSQGNYAVTKAFLLQFIQSGQGIDVQAESSGRRLVSVRTDASLAIDTNQNLGVNPSAIVDNKGVRVIDGKIGIGLTFQPGNGGLKLENQNQVKLAPTVTGAITFDGNNTIGDKLTASNGIKRVDNDLQSSLTFGTGLTRSGDAVNLQLNSGNTDIFVEGATITSNLETDGVTLVKTANIIKGNYKGGDNVTVLGNTISAKGVTAGDNVLVVEQPTGFLVSCSRTRRVFYGVFSTTSLGLW